MVRRRRARGRRIRRGYKKCIVNAMRGTKFKTPKAARKAFSRAAKKCRKMLAKGVVRRKARRRKRRAGRRRRRGVLPAGFARRLYGQQPGEFGGFSSQMMGRFRR